MNEKESIYDKEIPFNVDYFDEINIVRAGDRYEIKIFKDPEIRNRGKVFRKIEKSIKPKSDEEVALYHKQSLYRSRRHVENLIRANLNVWPEPENKKVLPPTFLTLTFAEHVTNLKKANEYHGLFLRKLNYLASHGKKNAFLHYVVVPELTKQKRVHYHILFFNLRYIKKEEIEKTWGHGFIKVKKAKDEDHTIEYLLKYITKETDRVWPEGSKRYSTSRGLRRPIEIRDDRRVNIFLSAYSDLIKKTMIKNGAYEHKYTGRVQYFVCDLKVDPLFKDILLAHEAELIVE